MLEYLIPEPKTKEVLFEKTLLSDTPATLVETKELSSKRKGVEESVNRTSSVTNAIAREMNRGLDSACDQDLHKLEQYLPILFNLVHYTDTVSQRVPHLKIRWSSGLISQSLIQRRFPTFYQVDSLMFELGMVLYIYAVKLREKAIELVSTDAQQSVKLYREASGVFHHLSQELIPSLHPLLPPGKLPELTSPLCSSLSLLCLAEGQAVTVKKAQESGKSLSLVSKLHYGITQMLTEASSLLSSQANGEYKDLSSRFLEYISTLGAFHELRSQKYLAVVVESDELGQAIGILRRALAAAGKSRPSKEDKWISIFKEEREEASTLLAKYERQNEVILEKVPCKTDLPYPKGEKIVNLIPYTPTRLVRELRFKS